MKLAEKPKETLNPHGFSAVPSFHLQTFRTQLAIDTGVEKKLLFRTWGGLGDQICAEPTLRYALKKFGPSCEVSLASEQPSLFQHLGFSRVFDLKKEQPIWPDYLMFDTIVPPSHLMWEFVSHMSTNCVDFPSLCSLRMQLPISDREITLKPSKSEWENVALLKPGKNWVAIHAGKHWQSKTFPKTWWDQVISHLLQGGCLPVLIGADTDDNRTTVDVLTDGCIDLRNRLSIMETVALLQQVGVLLTNDSSPLHMAASSSNCWIGYVATCKHPDYITHWRQGQWGYRMENLGKSGIWDVIDFCPNVEQEISLENVGDDVLKSWLPDPKDFAEWAITKAGCND